MLDHECYYLNTCQKSSGDISCKIGLNLLQTLTWLQYLDDEVVYSNLYHAQTVCEVAGPCQQFVHSTCNKQQKQFLVLNHSIFVNSAKETFFGIIPYSREKSGNLGQIKVELRKHKEVSSPRDLWDQYYFNVLF